MQYLPLKEVIQVEPFVGRIFEAAEIEVIAVNVNNRFQCFLSLEMKKPPQGRFFRLKLVG